MLASPTAPRSPDVQRLVDEGYAVTIDGQFLIVDNVPYVSSAGVISRGALISAYQEVDGIGQVNGVHYVWFTGSIPCTANGTPLRSSLVPDENPQVIAGRQVQCMLSNKPDPIGDMLDNYYNKMMHYIRKLGVHAREIDATASASATGSFEYRLKKSIFHYPNTAISRSGLDAYEAKLELNKVSIIGLGGTGAYILDALAKTPAVEIHMYDGDVIEPHNAYRLPGALTIEQAHCGAKKTEYLHQVYSSMRAGLVSHPVRVDNTNIHELDGSDFVFLAIDDGPSRGLIAHYLAEKGIPFIDVGIGVDKVTESVQLLGRARVTLVTPETKHLIDRLPTTDDREEAVYNNIQLVELNSINAALAIVRYKQYIGFFSDEEGADVVKYKSSWSRIVIEKKSDDENRGTTP